jgi:hypothetical protein
MNTKYQVWISGDKSSEETVEAINAADAAEKFVGKYESESAEYPVANGNATLDVVVSGDSDETIFSVSGYAQPVYSARLA